MQLKQICGIIIATLNEFIQEEEADSEVESKLAENVEALEALISPFQPTTFLPVSSSAGSDAEDVTVAKGNVEHMNLALAMTEMISPMVTTPRTSTSQGKSRRLRKHGLPESQQRRMIKICGRRFHRRNVDNGDGGRRRGEDERRWLCWYRRQKGNGEERRSFILSPPSTHSEATSALSSGASGGLQQRKQLGLTMGRNLSTLTLLALNPRVSNPTCGLRVVRSRRERKQQ
ncbi:hypothetical protein PIB30_011735 [Stylosanthes scabra]|uniref:Uncharacterized protein n=1 Tax=Stylosanthes scabra TaxID=79078 RepID=A0ABU6Z7P7_9FABA|nr:hypothetical protein [Stylosanthes scabra]